MREKMTNYNIAGQILEISTAEENYRQYTLMMNEYTKNVRSDFQRWYSKQDGIKEVYDNWPNIVEELFGPISDKGVEILNEHEIYTMNSGMLLDECVNGCVADFRDAVYDLMDDVDEIEDSQKEAREYRRERKANRSRAVGFGFGVGGAIKEAAKAGTVNAVTGTAHSLVNAVGNAGSAIAAGVNKYEIYSKSKEPLTDLMFQAVDTFCDNIRVFLAKQTDLEFKYVTVSEANQAKAILENYLSGKIPAEKKLENILKALRLSPYNFEIYKAVWNDYGDQTGDLLRMSDYFGKPLRKYVYDIATRECDSIFQERCAEYLASKNSITAAVKYEEDIKNAYDGIMEYVRDHNLEKEKMDIVGRCETIFRQIDHEVKMVDGVLYDSREEAQNIRKDKEQFYDYLKGKDIRDENIRDEIRALSYCSNKYKENVEDIIQEEIVRRNPVRIYENLKKIAQKYFPEGAINFEVNHIDFSFAKEPMIRKITEMPPNEGVVLFFDESNKGKKGLLFTNENFRVFAKGKILGENHAVELVKITGFECLGERNYIVRYDEGELKFSIKRDYDLEVQNQLCKCLQEICFVIQNLEWGDRKNLPYLTPESVLCECGTYIPDHTKVCSKCFKKYTGDGRFAETFSCPSCGSRIAEGKRFCTACGANVTATVTGIVETKAEKEESGETGEAPALTKAFKFCTQCGNKVEIGKKFCSRCGAVLKERRTDDE